LAAALALLTTGVAAEFTPVAGWDDQLFPSYLIATATMRSEAASDEEENDDAPELLGDRRGVLGVRVEAPGEEVPVTVTITSDAILEPSVFSGTLEAEGTTYTIFPLIKYKYGVMAKNKQSVPITVTFSVEIGDEESEERTETVTLRSVNDCPYAVYDADGAFTDVSYVFAAYVNEQHPFVDKVLREALDRGIVDSFTGYQSGDPAEVYRQVYALWDALSARDVRYSNITTSAAENRVISSQHVRLIDESINNSQANCVDGSVLLASLLRKIDIEPVLVFVPGHCYLAFYLDAAGEHMVGLETTLIGSESDDDTAEIEGTSDVVDEDCRKRNSWKTFCAAIVMGNQDLEENKDKFNKDNADYQTISIAAARKLGILPIACDTAEQFQAAETDEQ
jgi:hypothetical protein